LEIRFRKSKDSFLVVKTVKCKRGIKVCLYRTRPRFGGVREGMV